MQKRDKNHNEVDFIKIEPYQARTKKDKYCSNKTVILSFSALSIVLVLSFLIVCLIRFFG